MKRMFLMTLVLSVMAMGSAVANDAVSNRGPRKNRVVVVVKPGEILHDIFCCGHHHDCVRPVPPRRDCHHNKGFDWRDDHNRGKRPSHVPHGNNRPPKGPGAPDKGHKPGKR